MDGREKDENEFLGCLKILENNHFSKILFLVSDQNLEFISNFIEELNFYKLRTVF